MNLLEESLLRTGVGRQRLPVVGKVLVSRHLLHRRNQVFPSQRVEQRELFVGELVVPFALNLVKCGCGHCRHACTGAQLIERCGGFAVATELHEGFSLDEQHLGIAYLDAVDAVGGNLQVLGIVVAAVYSLAVDGRIHRRVVVIGESVLWVLELSEVGFGQSLVAGQLCVPVVEEVVVGHFGVVLAVSLAVLSVLEGECPRAVGLVVALRVVLVAVVGYGEEVLVGSALVRLILAAKEL